MSEITSLQHQPVDLNALHARLRANAERDGLLDVGYVIHDSPVGPLLLAATDKGLVRVAFAVQGHEQALGELARLVSPRILHAPARVDAARRELDDYLHGRRRTFDLPLDRRLSSGFRRTVHEHLSRIGFGTVQSYAQVAAAAGNPKAARAVGTACATNPLPLVVPCHRVVRADGSTGQYAGGADVKVHLLAMERTA